MALDVGLVVRFAPVRFLGRRGLVAKVATMALDFGIVGLWCLPIFLLLGHTASFRYRQRMASRPHDADGCPYLPTRWKTRKHPLDDGRDA